MLASIYALRRLECYSYLDGVRKRLNPNGKNIDDIDLPNWYECNRQRLETLEWGELHSYQKVYPVSMRLIDIFEALPNHAWSAVRYMNPDQEVKNEDFCAYLNNWRNNIPIEHPEYRRIVESIMGRFGR